MFGSIDEGARALLLTTCRILSDDGIRYVIAGGWVPFLRGGAVGWTALLDCKDGFNDLRFA
jgi:hypothetical protein